MKKAIILARVSDEKQDSNEAQVTRVSDLVKKTGIPIWKTYELKESSTQGDRKKFQEIIKDIQTSKETIALFVDTVDRLQRSFKESVILDDFRKSGKLEIHFYRENLVISKESNSSDLLRWDMAVMFARSYVLQLGDNVKRKQGQMKVNGQWIGQAPLGYLNTLDENDKKNIILNSEKSHFVVKIFELYSTGKYSIKMIAEEINKLGLKSKNSKDIVPSVIYHILNNPFYYGNMRIKGEEYPHRYEPLISKDLFNKCQQIQKGYHKKPFQYSAKPFILRGLIKCSKCGCIISPQIKKGKYIYYNCTNYKKICDRVYISEKELLEPVYGVLNGIRVPDDKIHYIVDGLRSLGKNEAYFHKQSMNSLKAEYDKIQTRIMKMYDDKLDGSITQDMYDKKLKEYKERQSEMLDQMQKHSDADEEFYITANTVLNLAKRALEIFESSEPKEKRQLLDFLLQNCRLYGKKLDFDLRFPFNIILETASYPLGLRG